MGTMMTWDKMVSAAFDRIQRAPDGSAEELAALEELERLQEYALDSMLVGRLQEAPCES